MNIANLYWFGQTFLPLHDISFSMEPEMIAYKFKNDFEV